MLRDAGAVLVAKLTTGELAQGDQWFGGRTNSPWDPAQGSSGSSAGSSSATAAGCVAFAHRHRDERIDSQSGRALRHPVAAADVRPHLALRRDGALVDAGSARPDGAATPRTAALVMQAIAKLDGRDMSVSDIPFNWDARLDIKKLRVGYIKESFDDLTNRRRESQRRRRCSTTLRSLGVTNFIEMKIPVSQTNVSSLGVESFVYFDEMRRAGKLTGSRMGNANRPTARLLPAVEYLQQQRLRMMMMTELAAATKGVDVYLVASNNAAPAAAADAAVAAIPRIRRPPAADGAGRPLRGDATGRRAGGDPAPDAARAVARGAAAAPARPQGPAQRHSTMANLACYPAMNVPNGFTAAGIPTNATFFARPFGEMELIALAKAYQDAAGHHLKKPAKLDA